ncbi:MAG: DUF2065 domain-containing protein [Gammaproteobacteria bacterium]|nr:DUF2065 domain-containing protein [Gammaproteobacteria bacterium]MDE0302337.1 DUF2065 domain-containing protein [Gammaproteobacteria bacterium]MDE0612657.1 DUF2065 domain-containing protein [Gammaproteobacteria bacterium]
MQWEFVLAAIALVIMLEGLIALLSPELARRMMLRMIELPTPQFRMMGLIAVTLGVLLLYLTRWLS